MILVDDQSGSKDLYPYIKSLIPDAILTRIDPPFGDVVWCGSGPYDQPLMVAVEYKKIDEVLDYVSGGGRFGGHQVGGLVEHYDRRYLLIEGRVRTDRGTGILQKLKGDRWQDISRGGRGFMYRDLEHWITTIEEQAQFRVKTTYDEYESARWVAAKHSWYTANGWEDHRSLKVFHVPPPPTATFTRPNLTRRWAKELEGVGWEKSMAAAARFGTPLELALGNEEAWRSIDGIGKTLSARIVTEIRSKG